jgi:anti-sigma factor RsiW
MRNPDHARLAEWDAAYVLGSLSPADRREFEDHLEDCERCAGAVAELSALPGLLGRIDATRAFALLDDAEGSADGLPGPAPADTAAAVRRHDRRRRLRTALIGTGALAAAAALASALTLAIPAALGPAPIADAVVQLDAVAGQAVPIDMAVSATRADWGTRLAVRCTYHSSPASYGPVTYSLWVIDSAGVANSVSTWNSAPGGEVRLEAGTATPLDQIAELQLRTADGSQTLMGARLP